MTTRVLNFLWLNLDLDPPDDPADGSIRVPMPKNYIQKIRDAGARHEAAEIDLWVDSKRLTKKQMKYLRLVLEDGLPNVHLRDLRSIPAYNNQKLYNDVEERPDWRQDWHCLIWRQVDCAKILVSLQGKFDQVFFADLDHAHLDIESDEVQKVIKRRGLLIGSTNDKSFSIENQLWGFDSRQRGFFEQYYVAALEDACVNKNMYGTIGNNAYKALKDKVWNEKILVEEICLLIAEDGTPATHPGHKWSSGRNDVTEPALISQKQLSAVFRKNSRRRKIFSKLPKLLRRVAP